MKQIANKITLEITKTTIIVAAVIFVLGYFVGSSFPATGIAGMTVQNGGSAAQGQAAQQTAPDQAPAQPAAFTFPSYVPYLGSSSAKVDVVEFGDYQCPFCERFFSQVEPSIMTDYVKTGKVKFYFMDFVFLGPDSATLSEGAWCANDQGKYYDYHDYIYGHQGQENSGWATADKVKAIAANVPGLDMKKFGDCLDNQTYASRAQELTDLGKNSGVSGTPTTFIGTPDGGFTPIVGAQPYDAFKQVIEQALSK